jgi:hypothetical protein
MGSFEEACGMLRVCFVAGEIEGDRERRGRSAEDCQVLMIGDSIDRGVPLTILADVRFPVRLGRVGHQ